MSLPRRSRPADEILAELDALKQHDVGGRTGGRSRWPTTPAPTSRRSATRRTGASAPTTRSTPTRSRACAGSSPTSSTMVAELLDGGPEAAGFMTTGGTESLLMAVKAARERGRAERGVDPAQRRAADERPRGVREGLPLLRSREPARRRARADWRADVDAMADAIDDDTVLVVGSAPQYPQGVIDPIADDRRAGRRAPDQLPRRRLHGRHGAPLPGASRRGRSRRGTSRCRA